MMTIAKANNASYVTISESPVRMKEIHRHHSFQVNLKGAKKKLFLSSNEKGATATVVVFLRVSPSREIPFFILRRVSGFVKEKRKNGEGTRATGGRPYGAEFFGGGRVVAPVGARTECVGQGKRLLAHDGCFSGEHFLC
mgnify:CR=1 FL=1